MNPVFWLLVILGLVLFWFFGAFLFKPLGKLGYRIWKDAIEELQDKNDKESKE